MGERMIIGHQIETCTGKHDIDKLNPDQFRTNPTHSRGLTACDVYKGGEQNHACDTFQNDDVTLCEEHYTQLYDIVWVCAFLALISFVISMNNVNIALSEKNLLLLGVWGLTSLGSIIIVGECFIIRIKYYINEKTEGV